MLTQFHHLGRVWKKYDAVAIRSVLVACGTGWEDKCRELYDASLVLPKTNCFGAKSMPHTIPLRHLRKFVADLPDDSVMGVVSHTADC